jgi:GT2 family glycosyltransferase
MAKLRVLVLNWNNAPETCHCLESLRRQEGIDFAVTVLDNGSTDGSAPVIRERFPEVDLQVSPVNLGFAEGCNVVLRQWLAARDDGYVLLLNNDAAPRPGCLRELFDVAIAARAAAVGAKVVSRQGTTLFEGAHWLSCFVPLRWQGSPAREDRIRTTDRVDGSAMVFSMGFLRQRLDEHGYVFDPAFFMYCEEMDLCLYARATGQRQCVALRAVVEHAEAASSGGRGTPRTYYYWTRNRIRLANRWFGRAGAALFHAYYVPTRLAILAGKVARSRPAVARALWSGLKDGYRSRMGKWDHHQRD